VSSDFGTPTAIDSSMGWTRITSENQTAPSSGVTKMAAIVYQDSGNKTIGNYFLIDAVKIEMTSVTLTGSPSLLNVLSDDSIKTKSSSTKL